MPHDVIEVDPHARCVAVEKFALPDCLHLPVAARNEQAVRRYVGKVICVVAPGSPANALLVEALWPYQVDPTLSIWRLPTSSVLRQTKQLWVHVDYRAYRLAYRLSLIHISNVDFDFAFRFNC